MAARRKQLSIRPGKFVYVSNRDPYNSIAIFSIDLQTKAPMAIGHQAMGARKRRATLPSSRPVSSCSSPIIGGKHCDCVSHQPIHRRTRADERQRAGGQPRLCPIHEMNDLWPTHRSSILTTRDDRGELVYSALSDDGKTFALARATGVCSGHRPARHALFIESPLLAAFLRASLPTTPPALHASSADHRDAALPTVRR